MSLPCNPPFDDIISTHRLQLKNLFTLRECYTYHSKNIGRRANKDCASICSFICQSKTAGQDQSSVSVSINNRDVQQQPFIGNLWHTLRKKNIQSLASKAVNSIINWDTTLKILHKNTLKRYKNTYIHNNT
jgi:hypothetical protein